MNASSLPQILSTRRLGSESFTANGQPLGLSLLEFWQWSGSDLVGNTARGVLAEFIVAAALGIHRGVRSGWEAYDLVSSSGITVEVKSSAYLQSWHQVRPSRISFSIRAARAWDASTNILAADAQRQAMVYVFALLHHPDKATLNPLELDQWEFLVLPASALNRHLKVQRTVSLSRLQSLNPTSASYSTLGSAIEVIGARGAGTT